MDGVRRDTAPNRSVAPTHYQTSKPIQQRVMHTYPSPVFDSAVSEKLTTKSDPLQRYSHWYAVLKEQIQNVLDYMRLLRTHLRVVHISATNSSRQALYFSLAGGVAFGVFMTAFSFIMFDRGVSAQSEETATIAHESSYAASNTDTNPEAGEYDESVIAEEGADADIFLEYFNEAAEEEYQAKIAETVKGYPIEAMLPYIFEKDRTVAAFLIGIGKKESNWGKRVPVLDGQDCFNYWGYRGVRRLMGTGGHTCFNSRKDAVDTVAKRIEKLVYSEKLDTPEKMILWKCGFSCEGHSRESVKKWISDVSLYFSALEGNDL